MKHRVTALALSLALLSSTVPAFATETATSPAQEAANALYELGLFNGTGTNEDGTPIFELDRAPNRQEAITMLVRLLGKEEEAKAGTWNTPFTDLAEWATPYVGYAYTNGLTNGTSETTFGSTDPVSAAQYLTFVLRALGYEDGTDFQWYEAWVKSDEIGLTSGQFTAETTAFTRGDVAVISRQTLNAARKGTNETLLQAIFPSASESTYAPLDVKIQILEVYRQGLVYKAKGLQLLGDALNYLSNGNYSITYETSYLATTSQFDQGYIDLAIKQWEKAVTLCDNYSDTKSMKQNLTQLIEIYSSAMSYKITKENVFDYLVLRLDGSEDDFINEIENIANTWAMEALKAQ